MPAIHTSMGLGLRFPCDGVWEEGGSAHHTSCWGLGVPEYQGPRALEGLPVAYNWLYQTLDSENQAISSPQSPALGLAHLGHTEKIPIENASKSFKKIGPIA